MDKRDLTHTAIECLRRGRYEEAERLIQGLRSRSLVANDRDARRMLEVAQQICQACLDISSETNHHREALSTLAADERELKRALKTILELFPGTPTREDVRTAPSVALVSEDSPALEGDRVSASWRRRRIARRPRIPRHDAGSGRSSRGRRTSGRKKAPGTGLPYMTAYCLGQFQVYFDDQLVESWPSDKGKTIFKFLLHERARAIGKEVLMNTFWPEFEPPAARNNLNVAIYSLRQALGKVAGRCSIILFRNDCYLLNPLLDIWVDVEAFADRVVTARACEQQGDLRTAMSEYCAAEALYRGEFLEEDRYEEWPAPIRRNLENDYLSIVDHLSEWSLQQGDHAYCLHLCNKALGIDPCHEKSHQRIMQCWSRQGLPHLAIRQYDVCRSALQRELDLQPSEASDQLRGLIERGEAI
jgi:DNA-binding SARP family transcriptional activator